MTLSIALSISKYWLFGSSGDIVGQQKSLHKCSDYTRKEVRV